MLGMFHLQPYTHARDEMKLKLFCRTLTTKVKAWLCLSCRYYGATELQSYMNAISAQAK